MSREKTVAGLYVFEWMGLRPEEKLRVQCVGVVVGSMKLFDEWFEENGEEAFLHWYASQKDNQVTLQDVGING